MAKTYHSKSGKFTSYNHASSISDGGKRFKMVRTLEPIKPPEQASEPTSETPPGDVAEMVMRAQALARRRTGTRGRWLPIDEMLSF